MNPLFGSTEAENFAQMRRHLEEVRAKYEMYEREPSLERRTELMRLMPLAERACRVANVAPGLRNPYGDVLAGLTNIALAFENPRFTLARGSRERIVLMTLDAIDMAWGSLADDERVASEREGKLGHRVERVARKVFGFPVSVLGVVLGFRPEDLEGAKAQLAFLASMGTTLGILYGASKKVLALMLALGVSRGWW